MRKFKLHPIAAASFLSILFAGILGTFVVVPIACINWTWNTVASHFDRIPLINAWQSGLLYIAAACLLYLSGIVHIEVKTGSAD